MHSLSAAVMAMRQEMTAQFSALRAHMVRLRDHSNIVLMHLTR
jgi:hypothetical protein